VFEDNEPPTFTCPDNDNVQLNSDCELIVPDLLTGITDEMDNCSVVLTQVPSAETIIASSHNSLETVVITAEDPSGNTNIAACEVVLTAQDITPPTFSCPDNFDVNLNANCELIIPDLTALIMDGNDNCSFSFVQTPPAETTIPGVANTTQAIDIVAEDLAGNTTPCTVIVTARDITPPTFTCPDGRLVITDPMGMYAVPD
jgi:hypothetical protein